MTPGRRIEIRGTVQGVGFRPWVYRLAVEGGVSGRVRNDASGVTIDAFGSPAALDRFAAHLASSVPPAAEIYETRSSDIPGESLTTFSIVSSGDGAEPVVSIPADLTTCRECLEDITDPSNRRFGYPFTNCTNCGPRFTIASDIPYDRATTTMAAFTMCQRCRAEYERASDRRFHAEPIACPACGPRLTLRWPDGTAVAIGDPLDVVAQFLAAGAIVAIKGLGGFHLACDATSHEAVARLRQRKGRDEKPFAVMVATPAAADAIAALTGEERRLLTSVARPIVLARRRPTTRLAENIAPGLPLVGVMLPYTPLHHLLLERAGRPLVMTSGNVSDAPLAYGNDEALAQLGMIADLFLLHDREIAAPCDDSVAIVIRTRAVVLRRSRGYVPSPIAVAPRFDRPVLACGALLKNTFCVGVADRAYLGPHIGDLDNLAAYERYVESIDRMLRLVRTSPGIVAYDLHPDYISTRYALSRPEPLKIAVQHHHAHIVSAMAEHGLPGPVIGVAYDGTGHGLDGTSWGGEIMIARRDAFDRVATLRAIPLAGADRAIRHPWRIALALLEDAFAGAAPLDALPLFGTLPTRELEVTRQMLAARVNSPLAHGAGRYFDGIASLVLDRPSAAYEAQLAQTWGAIADGADGRSYGFTLDRSATPWLIDLRQMVRDVVADLLANVHATTIAARFHNTLAAATAAAVRLAADGHGRLPVVLTGGCFQNARLAEGVASLLAARFDVHLHERVPPGDGGLALGQAVVAAAIAKRM